MLDVFYRCSLALSGDMLFFVSSWIHVSCHWIVNKRLPSKSHIIITDFQNQEGYQLQKQLDRKLSCFKPIKTILCKFLFICIDSTNDHNIKLLCVPYCIIVRRNFSHQYIVSISLVSQLCSTSDLAKRCTVECILAFLKMTCLLMWLTINYAAIFKAHG